MSKGENMKALLVFLSTALMAAPAFSHPGMSDSAVHVTMHSMMGLETFMAVLVVWLIAWGLRGYLRSIFNRLK